MFLSCNTRHFETLDGLRGFAAFAVLVYHALSHYLIPKGFLAVDFFFVLSGFVIAIAYEKSLLSELSFVRFFEIRLIRYPIIRIFQALIEAKHIHGLTLAAVVVLELAVAVCSSYLALVLYDEPARRLLRKALAPQLDPRAAESA